MNKKRTAMLNTVLLKWRCNEERLSFNGKAATPRIKNKGFRFGDFV